MLSDLAHAARALRRTPGYAISAVFVLACGVGAATAVFTVLSAVLLRPLPYADPDALVVLLHDGQAPVSPADYFDYRRDARSFTAIEAAQYASMTLTGPSESTRVEGLAVSAGMFDLLGVAPALGRTFARGEDRPGRDHVVVLSHGLWMERFGGDRSIVGRSIVLNGEPYAVVGVMPEGFGFAPFWATGARLWRPLTLASRLDDRAGRSLRLFARRAPGIGHAPAQAEASTIAARLAAAYPDTNRGLDIEVVPLHEKTTAAIRPTLVALTAMVALVLLVACANVATLQLVRGSSRQKELAVRAALGARRGRIVRQLLAESVLIGVAASVAGLAIGAWSVSALVAFIPPHAVPRQSEIALDPVAFAIAAGAGLLAAVAAGLVPAWQLTRTDPQEALRDGSRTATSHGHGRAVRRTLVATELALAMVLLAGAGLMGRTLVALQAIDPGFDPDHVLALTVVVDGLPHAEPARRLPYFERVGTALAALPGVERVGAINHLPLAGDTWRFRFQLEEHPVAPAERPSATWRVVTPGYFDTMRIALRGRGFEAHDGATGVPVALVNEAMAAKHWPGRDPIGTRIRVGSEADAPWLTVVGVAANARQNEWAGPVTEELYVPYAQHAAEFGGTQLTFVLRTAGEPALAATAASRAVWSVDAAVPVDGVTTMARVVAERMWRARLTAALVAGFAGAALLLAAVGVYTVTAYVMARRTREIGIRIALGATAAHVRRLAAAETLAPIVAGLAAGVALAAALSRVMASLLYGVAPGDAWSFAAAAFVLVTVGAAAAWWPAHRASRVAPVVALREE